jgi:uncharacterized protein (TIGR02147 family)
MDSVFKYQNYRTFLFDFYKEKKSANRTFSHRLIARKLGLRSSSHFSQIIKGSVNISSDLAIGFAQLMGLKKRETEYFTTLVHFNQAKSIREKSLFFEKLTAFAESTITIIQKSQYELFEKWYYIAIRDLLPAIRFKGNFVMLAKTLIPPISVKEATRAILLLERLKLIYRDNDGLYKRADKTISSGHSIDPFFAYSYLKQTLQLAMEAIDRFPPRQRSISSLTLSLPEEGYELINEELKLFRRRMLQIAKEYSSVDGVYQVNFQIFPLSKPRKVHA